MTFLSDYTLSKHSVSYLFKSGNVCADNIVARKAVLLCSGVNVVEDVNHNIFQILINLLKAPRHSFGVLRHLQSRAGYAARVSSLAGSKKHALFLEELGCF